MNYESELTGGHPNSLGNTIKVVEHVIVKKNRINSLIKCYSSTDQIVRLRTSNAFTVSYTHLTLPTICSV